MWCNKCHYGSEVTKLTDKCPQCGNTRTHIRDGLGFTDKCPFPFGTPGRKDIEAREEEKARAKFQDERDARAKGQA